jgi:uncharacterized protein
MHHQHMRVIFPTLILCAFFLSVPILFPVPARAASFDCAKARFADERAVCASRSLSEMDVEMAVRFETLTGLVAMGTRGDMGDEQKLFLTQRRQCGADNACLTALYKARIAKLKSQYQGLKSRGPF